MGRKNDYLWPGPTKSECYEELREIGLRIGAMVKFEKTHAFSELDSRQRNLFEAQLGAMRSYQLLLTCRIDDWPDDL